MRDEICDTAVREASSMLHALISRSRMCSLFTGFFRFDLRFEPEILTSAASWPLATLLDLWDWVDSAWIPTDVILLFSLILRTCRVVIAESGSRPPSSRLHSAIFRSVRLFNLHRSWIPVDVISLLSLTSSLIRLAPDYVRPYYSSPHCCYVATLNNHVNLLFYLLMYDKEQCQFPVWWQRYQSLINYHIWTDIRTGPCWEWHCVVNSWHHLGNLCTF